MVDAECRIYLVQFGLNLIWGLSGFRSAVEGSVITLEGSWKTQWSDLFHAARQQSQAVCCWASLSILKTLFPAPTVFFRTNQSGIKSLSPSPRALSLRDFTAGSHSSGMNLSRLVHSAKGHYPRLHVCWVAVLSNSTRCCCDHEVTCEDVVLLCTSFIQLFHVAFPFIPGMLPSVLVKCGGQIRMLFKVGKCTEALTNTGEDFIWWQIMGWINVSKLQFNAQGTTCYVFCTHSR